MYNSKNYSTDGGGTLVIGGKLKVEESAEVEGMPANPLTPATASALGGIKIGTGLSVESDGTASVTPATSSALGGVIVGGGLNVESDGTVSVTGAAAQADAEAAGESDDVVKLSDFNALLEKLRAAGLMATE